MSASKPAHCALLYLPAENRFRELELTLQKEEQETKAYIDVYGSPLKPDPEGKVPLILTIDGNSSTFLATPLKGNQRLLLPDSAEKELLNALENRKSIRIEAGRYCQEIIYTGFEKALETFNEAS